MATGIVFHAVAALAYALLAACLWRHLAHNDTLQHARRLTRFGLLGALCLQGLALYLSIFRDTSLFIGGAIALSAAIWLGLVIFWLENQHARIDGLLLLLLPSAAAVCALASIFPQGQMVPHANNAWLRVHLIIALVAYSLMTVAVLQALLMALLDRYLHWPGKPRGDHPRIHQVLALQPPLLMQEHLLFRSILLGFVMLTLTVATGAMVSYKLQGRALPLDQKTAFTLLSWLNFGVLLLGRYLKGWRGRVALRGTLAGFLLLILAYTGSRFLLAAVSD